MPASFACWFAWRLDTARRDGSAATARRGVVGRAGEARLGAVRFSHAGDGPASSLAAVLIVIITDIVLRQGSSSRPCNGRPHDVAPVGAVDHHASMYQVELTNSSALTRI